MNNKENTKIRQQAKQAAFHGHYSEAVRIIDNSITEQNRTFDDWLELVKYLSLSKAWLQANCAAEIAFNKINTDEQKQRFTSLQKRLNPPKITDLIRGKQFGADMPIRSHVDGHKHSL
ncbi:MAG: hypothetical protein H6860_02840 [Rhodospirillales bacterium]|nr:hypothetical protein [Alphaproteobacteria bacterium]MCB9981315.1 hypothetical protein [Rhodospirillales bacterium]